MKNQKIMIIKVSNRKLIQMNALKIRYVSIKTVIYAEIVL